MVKLLIPAVLDRGRMSLRYNTPDPLGLAIAREMQERLKPAEIILQGSRAAGDHRPDSDVDLMAVCTDESAVREADETLRQLLEGRYEVPVVNVVTITRSEFLRTAPLAQSHAGQAARHGVTPCGRGLGYRPEREPEPGRGPGGHRVLARNGRGPPGCVCQVMRTRVALPDSYLCLRGPDGTGTGVQRAAHRRQRLRQISQGRGADVAAHGRDQPRCGPERCGVPWRPYWPPLRGRTERDAP